MRLRTALTALAALGLAMTSTTAYAASYPAGRHSLVIDKIQIYDISHTVDSHEYCAEVYGRVTVTHAGKTLVFFNATRDHYQQVCEPNRPLNWGLQAGYLQGSSDPLTGDFTGDEKRDEPFVFHVNLWDADIIGATPLVKHQTVKVWPERVGIMPERVDFEDGTRLPGHRLHRDGHTYVRVQYDTTNDDQSSMEDLPPLVDFGD
ncbi:hypothetical protein [Streptomyces sp. NPDC005303]|uniref:hypothetical protein n=1 Tax=Streptomyces sp. NPDC005303 TaxID=3155713 RepID=UPI0033BF7E0B